MSVLSAQSIRKRGIFTPFHERTLSHGMTHGLGPAGYDIRIGETVNIERGGEALSCSLEHFDMPNDCIAYVKDKSTLAREFLFVQNTVIEPGWHGILTLELTYQGKRPFFTLPYGMPIAQVVFHMLDEPTDQPYSGKYQDQKAGAQPALFEVRR